ncbi:unnamed protein product [Trichogramma brassicae]|uniref:Uncharacterized protein n=1 Tax=Trichogramma brassicae TaxID=86971 RepID=A0A6H5J1S1_9HYME|nr:unnamed protein product [Trichogramma brassicae]
MAREKATTKRTNIFDSLFVQNNCTERRLVAHIEAQQQHVLVRGCCCTPAGIIYTDDVPLGFAKFAKTDRCGYTRAYVYGRCSCTLRVGTRTQSGAHRIPLELGFGLKRALQRTSSAVVGISRLSLSLSLSRLHCAHVTLYTFNILIYTAFANACPARGLSTEQLRRHALAHSWRNCRPARKRPSAKFTSSLPSSYSRAQQHTRKIKAGSLQLQFEVYARPAREKVSPALVVAIALRIGYVVIYTVSSI